VTEGEECGADAAKARPHKPDNGRFKPLAPEARERRSPHAGKEAPPLAARS